jgi:hypothetical protein
MDLSRHRAQVARALEALETSIEDLVNALAHSGALACIEGASEADPLRRACQAYSAINYRMEDEVGASVVCLGALGTNAEMLKRAAAVNTLKAEFKGLCAPLYRVRIRVPVKGEPSPTKAISALRVILRNIQRSDLNLLAAYRKIPILDAPPASITYTRAFTRAVYRKSVDEILTLLRTSERKGASADRARLETLSPRETHLALVKERYQNIRANILYARMDARGRGRVQIAAELPILYSQGRSAAPEIHFPPPADEPRAVRRIRQSKLEATPFLESLPAYRYARSVGHRRP